MELKSTQTTCYFSINTYLGDPVPKSLSPFSCTHFLLPFSHLQRKSIHRISKMVSRIVILFIALIAIHQASGCTYQSSKRGANLDARCRCPSSSGSESLSFSFSDRVKQQNATAYVCCVDKALRAICPPGFSSAAVSNIKRTCCNNNGGRWVPFFFFAMCRF